MDAVLVFFFSSRRRHTRWTGDWSSDVCSSDLAPNVAVTAILQVSGVPNGTVLFISDEGQTMGRALPAGGAGTVRWRTTPAASAYVRAEVRHPSSDPSGLIPGAMAALTNPIFLGPPSTA